MLLIILPLLIQLKISDGSEIVFPKDPPPCDTNKETCIPVTDCDAFRGRENSAKKCGWNDSVPLVCCSLKERRLNDNECGLTVSSPGSIRSRRISRANPSVEAANNTSGVFSVSIVGGKPSLENSRPWMAALSYREPGTNGNFELICGGTLIGSKYILTAAHCFDGRSRNVNNYIVNLGDNNYFPNTNGLSIKSIIKHKKYRPPLLYNDIAIVTLRKKIDYSDAIRAICLPDPVTIGRILMPPVITISAGWGRLGFFNGFSNQLQEVDLPIVANSRCNEIYTERNLLATHYPNGIVDSMLCAGYEDEKKDACQGDSGGPLFLKDPSSDRWTIVGIVSSGYSCGAGVPGLYTRVDIYSRWIKFHTYHKKKYWSS